MDPEIIAFALGVGIGVFSGILLTGVLHLIRERQLETVIIPVSGRHRPRGAGGGGMGQRVLR